MNHITFMTRIVEIYGPYDSKVLEKITLAYIKDKFQESELKKVFDMIIIKVNPKFKFCPSPADFEEIFFSKNHEAEALEWWGRLTRTGNSLDNVDITDIRAQAVIEDFGGWTEFCQRSPETEHFHQAKFIKWFVMYSKQAPERQRRVLIGDSVKSRQPLVFGDKSQALQISEDEKPIEGIKELSEELTKWQKLSR